MHAATCVARWAGAGIVCAAHMPAMLSHAWLLASNSAVKHAKINFGMALTQPALPKLNCPVRSTTFNNSVDCTRLSCIRHLSPGIKPPPPSPPKACLPLDPPPPPKACKIVISTLETWILLDLMPITCAGAEEGPRSECLVARRLHQAVPQH